MKVINYTDKPLDHIPEKVLAIKRANDRGIGQRFELDLTPTAFKRLAPLMRGSFRSRSKR